MFNLVFIVNLCGLILGQYCVERVRKCLCDRVISEWQEARALIIPPSLWATHRGTDRIRPQINRVTLLNV